MKTHLSNTLAIEGGSPVRENPLPPRINFCDCELEMVKRVFQNSWKLGKDFFSQGKFEDEFTEKYCEFQGGGYADAVSSGTSAVYIASLSIRALVELINMCNYFSIRQTEKSLALVLL